MKTCQTCALKLAATPAFQGEFGKTAAWLAGSNNPSATFGGGGGDAGGGAAGGTTMVSQRFFCSIMKAMAYF